MDLLAWPLQPPLVGAVGEGLPDGARCRHWRRADRQDQGGGGHVTAQRVINTACSRAPWRSSFPLGDDWFAGAAQVVVDPFPHGLNSWSATRRWRLTAKEAATGRSERSREPAKGRSAVDGEDVPMASLITIASSGSPGNVMRRTAMSCAKARTGDLALPQRSGLAAMPGSGKGGDRCRQCCLVRRAARACWPGGVTRCA